MKTLVLLMIVLMTTTSCGRNSSPEKRMNINSHKLEQKIAAIVKQEQILRDSISMLNKELAAIKHK